MNLPRHVEFIEESCWYQIPAPLLGILGDREKLINHIRQYLTDLNYVDEMETSLEGYRIITRIVVASVKYQIWMTWNRYRDSGHYQLTSSMAELVVEYFAAADEVNLEMDRLMRLRALSNRHSLSAIRLATKSSRSRS